MATERQIAANRRNARKSTGPRSAAGRKTSSQNALRHGLSSRTSSADADFEQQLETLARHFAGDTDDITRLGWARLAAEAELELQLIRRLKATMIERVIAYGDLDGPKIFRSDTEQLRWIKANIHGLAGRGPLQSRWPETIDPSATMPKEEPNRTAEAIRRLLPEFVRLQRYEERAAGRRDRAIRNMMRIKARKS
jgi:hypothetical protein